MSLALQRSAWLIAALVSALAVPLAGLGDVTTGCAAGTATVLTGGALEIWRNRGQSRVRGAGLISLGLLMSAVVTAGSTLELGSAWTIAAGALVSAAVLVAGLFGWSRSSSALQVELESLRSRLVRREGDVRAQADRIRQLDLHDNATGVLNRRGFALGAESALTRCNALREPAALILIELSEPLASVSGGAGAAHAARLSRAVNRALRGSDLVGRWDDRTLVALLPQCDDSGPALERLRGGLLELIGDAWSCSGISVEADGPWPEVEGLVAAAQTSLQRHELRGRVLPFRAAESRALAHRD
ncbi:MAG: diguanylate cyclase [Acidobacteriota bacterium]